jgi:aryl-alcohol dehydrogenase-like predicted oxidoreductase
MEYTRFGNTGLVVSRFAFGAMTLGSGNVPAVYKVDEESAQSLIDRALDEGINFFDTADAYAAGQSESMLGKLLGKRRHAVVLSTKVGMRTGDALVQTGLSRRHVIASCEASLNRLGTDYVDLYIVHRFDAITPVEETLRALDDLLHAGKVRYVGFSNWSAWQAAKSVGIQERAGLARLAWLLNRPGVDTILLGASKRAQLEDNLRALRVRLSLDEMRLLDELSAHASYYPSWFNGKRRDQKVHDAIDRRRAPEAEHGGDTARLEGAARP